MNSMELIGLNLKWHRYQKGWTQEDYANRTNFKMTYISTIETGTANLTCKNIDFIANSFNISPKQLFEEKTAQLAKNFPKRIDTYEKSISKF